jgi:hypothetical protein
MSILLLQRLLDCEDANDDWNDDDDDDDGARIAP